MCLHVSKTLLVFVRQLGLLILGSHQVVEDFIGVGPVTWHKVIEQLFIEVISLLFHQSIRYF